MLTSDYDSCVAITDATAVVALESFICVSASWQVDLLDVRWLFWDLGSMAFKTFRALGNRRCLDLSGQKCVLI